MFTHIEVFLVAVFCLVGWVHAAYYPRQAQQPYANQQPQPSQQQNSEAWRRYYQQQQQQPRQPPPQQQAVYSPARGPQNYYSQPRQPQQYYPPPAQQPQYAPRQPPAPSSYSQRQGYAPNQQPQYSSYQQQQPPHNYRPPPPPAAAPPPPPPTSPPAELRPLYGARPTLVSWPSWRGIHPRPHNMDVVAQEAYIRRFLTANPRHRLSPNINVLLQQLQPRQTLAAVLGQKSGSNVGIGTLRDNTGRLQQLGTVTPLVQNTNNPTPTGLNLTGTRTSSFIQSTTPFEPVITELEYEGPTTTTPRFPVARIGQGFPVTGLVNGTMTRLPTGQTSARPLVDYTLQGSNTNMPSPPPGYVSIDKFRGDILTIINLLTNDAAALPPNGTTGNAVSPKADLKLQEAQNIKAHKLAKLPGQMSFLLGQLASKLPSKASSGRTFKSQPTQAESSSYQQSVKADPIKSEWSGLLDLPTVPSPPNMMTNNNLLSNSALQTAPPIPQYIEQSTVPSTQALTPSIAIHATAQQGNQPNQQNVAAPLMESPFHSPRKILPSRNPAPQIIFLTINTQERHNNSQDYSTPLQLPPQHPLLDASQSAPYPQLDPSMLETVPHASQQHQFSVQPPPPTGQVIIPPAPVPSWQEQSNQQALEPNNRNQLLQPNAVPYDQQQPQSNSAFYDNQYQQQQLPLSNYIARDQQYQAQQQQSNYIPYVQQQQQQPQSNAVSYNQQYQQKQQSYVPYDQPNQSQQQPQSNSVPYDQQHQQQQQRPQSNSVPYDQQYQQQQQPQSNSVPYDQQYQQQQQQPQSNPVPYDQQYQQQQQPQLNHVPYDQQYQQQQALDLNMPNQVSQPSLDPQLLDWPVQPSPPPKESYQPPPPQQVDPQWNSHQQPPLDAPPPPLGQSAPTPAVDIAPPRPPPLDISNYRPQLEPLTPPRDLVPTSANNSPLYLHPPLDQPMFPASDLAAHNIYPQTSAQL